MPKILTKVKGKRHGSKFGFHTGWSIYSFLYKSRLKTFYDFVFALVFLLNLPSEVYSPLTKLIAG